jgi:hypothetical protein
MGSNGLVTEDKPKVEVTSLTDAFEKACPIYMSYGMSYNDFWYGSAFMTKFYRESHKLKIQEQDENNWMIGTYVYEAIMDCSPILRAFSKAKKPLPYAQKPYLYDKLTEDKKTEEQKEQEKEAERLKFTIQMNNWFHATKRQFDNKK